MMKIEFNLTILVFLLIIQAVHAQAVTQPVPSNVTLKGGESLTFKFQIQAMSVKEDQLCTYSMAGLDNFKFSFDEEETLVEAGGRADVIGTLEVPLKTPSKQYEGKLLVSCMPNIEAKGVAMLTGTTRYPFYVRVEKSEKTEGFDWRYLLVLFVIAIIIVISVIIRSKYWLKIKEVKNKSQQEK